jgi:HlyD family secretion protein
MSVRRSLFVMAVLVALLPMFFFNATNTPEPTSNAARDNIQIYEVRTGNVTLSVSAVGSLSPNQSVNLSFLLAGRVQDVFVQRDDYVLADDPLITLDNTLQRLAYEQALLNVERAELSLEDLLTVDPLDIELAQSAVDSAWGSLISVNNSVSDADIQAAELSYQQAVEALDIATVERDRAPDTQYETLNAQVGEASFNAEIARLQLEELRNATAPQANAAYSAVLQAQAELERVKAGATDFEIDAAEIAIQQAESQLEQTRINYERTTLRAPFDGVISAVNVETGALIAPGLATLELTDVDPLRLVIQVDEIDIGLIDEGLPVRVELDALQGVEYPATVETIASVGTNQGGIVSYDVEVIFDEIDPRARVGMTAEAIVIINEVTGVLNVPNLYIRIDRADGQAYVNTIDEDGNITEVPVELGLRGQTNSEIVSGLNEGDLVAVQLGGGGLSSFIGN